MSPPSDITNGFHNPRQSRSVSPTPVQSSPSVSSTSSTVSAVNTEKSSRESSRLSGTVKWFNAKNGYGFITRNDTGEDVFVHFSGIGRKNPRHAMKSLGDGEIVEFNIMATNVTGPAGRPVRGNPYVSYIPVRRNDSFAAGDPVMFPNHRSPRYIRGAGDFGSSRIPRWIPNWRPM